MFPYDKTDDESEIDELREEIKRLQHLLDKATCAIGLAIVYFEGPNDDVGGVQRWETESNTGGKKAYKALKRALEGEKHDA